MTQAHNVVLEENKKLLRWCVVFWPISLGGVFFVAPFMVVGLAGYCLVKMIIGYFMEKELIRILKHRRNFEEIIKLEAT